MTSTSLPSARLSVKNLREIDPFQSICGTPTLMTILNYISFDSRLTVLTALQESGVLSASLFYERRYYVLLCGPACSWIDPYSFYRASTSYKTYLMIWRKLHPSEIRCRKGPNGKDLELRWCKYCNHCAPARDFRNHFCPICLRNTIKELSSPQTTSAIVPPDFTWGMNPSDERRTYFEALGLLQTWSSYHGVSP